MQNYGLWYILVFLHTDALKIQEILEQTWGRGAAASCYYSSGEFSSKLMLADLATSVEHFPNVGFGPSDVAPRWTEMIWRKGELTKQRMQCYLFDGNPMSAMPDGRLFDGIASWQYGGRTNIADRRGSRIAVQPMADTYGDMIGQPGDVVTDERTVAGTLRNKEPYRLHELLPSGLYRENGREAVDGIPCVIFERPGLDKVWLGIELGYSLVRREWNWHVGGPIKRRINNRSFRNIDGVWFPFSGRMEAFGSPRTKPGRLCLVVEMQANEVRIGISGEEFRPELPDGTLVMDNIEHASYRVWGFGTDDERREYETRLRPNHRWTFIAWGTAGVSLIGALVLLLLRRRQA